MNIKRLITLLLVFVMTILPMASFSMEKSDIVLTSDDGVVQIDGVAGASKNVNIVISKGGKRYFLDSLYADSNGKYSFKTVLPINTLFNAEITSDRETLDINIDTATSYSNIDLNDANAEEVTISEDKIEIDISKKAIKKDMKIKLTKSNVKKLIDVKYLEESTNKLIFNIEEVKKNLPEIRVTRKNLVLKIPKGTAVLSGSVKNFELMNQISKTDNGVRGKILSLVSSNKELNKIEQAVRLGSGESIIFNKFIEIEFKNAIGKNVAFIQGDKVSIIKKFSSEAEGIASGLLEFAFEKGSSIIVKTKHFTDFIVFSIKDKIADSPGNGGSSSGGSGGSSGKTPTTPKVTISIDLNTIGGGYILNSTTVEFKIGDSVWDITKKLLEQKKIPYSAEFTKKYNSVYVQMIRGEGEFDHGSGSGWMYSVNGRYPDVGASRIKPSSGSIIKWRYTTNLGKDVGAKVPNNKDDESTLTSKTANSSINEDVKSTSENQELGLNNESKLSDYYNDTDEFSTWSYKEILKATSLKLVNGYDGKFNPKKEITRAEFIAIMIRVLDLNINTTNAISFDDVNYESWYFRYINAAYKAGIIRGSGESFNPDSSITREEMATIIARSVKLKQSSDKFEVLDLDMASEWSREYITLCVNSGLIIGYDDKFNPKGIVTREMAAVVSVRVYEIKKLELEAKIDVEKLSSLYTVHKRPDQLYRSLSNKKDEVVLEKK